MIVHRDLSQTDQLQHSAITIGVFDGVHKGHREIISTLIEESRKHNTDSVLITFHPHPRIALKKDLDRFFYLNTIEEKEAQLSELGIDHLFIVPFTKEFSDQTADEYLRNFIAAHFKPKCIVIGYDHKFGNDRKGDFQFMKSLSKELGYGVKRVFEYEEEGSHVSSTEVRKALLAGDVSAAASLLGYNYPLQGEVVKGQQIGSTIGFPTANLQPKDSMKLIPAEGVYAVRIQLNDQVYGGMLNIGTNPTIEGDESNRKIEVNIFDFEEDIYNQNLGIEFVEAIRKEKKFTNLEQLAAQLQKDRMECLKLLE